MDILFCFVSLAVNKNIHTLTGGGKKAVCEKLTMDEECNALFSILYLKKRISHFIKK